MDEYKKNILKDRLHKLESNKAIIRKRLGAIDKPDQENILSTLIGKYYKAKELNEATVCIQGHRLDSRCK